MCARASVCDARVWPARRTHARLAPHASDDGARENGISRGDACVIVVIFVVVVGGVVVGVRFSGGGASFGVCVRFECARALR